MTLEPRISYYYLSVLTRLSRDCEVDHVLILNTSLEMQPILDLRVS